MRYLRTTHIYCKPSVLVDASVICTDVYVYVYNQNFQRSMDQPRMVINPARGQLNRENEYFPVPVRA